MLFNTGIFWVFFIFVFTAYHALKHKRQNFLLLAASYFFYGFWDWRFLFLIVFSTGLDYLCGLQIERNTKPAPRKRWLSVSIIGNLSVLCFFKYFNFFADGFTHFWAIFGWKTSPVFLDIILPLGISFYTFQTMAYSIDVYRREVKAVRNFPDFALFVSFFPQLIAGPIERAKNLLPQIRTPRSTTWQQVSRGCFLILWGLFLKVYVADNLAQFVDPLFASKAPYNGAFVLTAVYAFAFQILCDFAGYSTMARGIASCLGFDLMVNFKQPYYASNPREFWQNWHISLSTWLKDYLYVPLGGNRNGSLLTYRNLMITMILGGLWHGAAWTFVLWGLYHGILLVTHRLFEKRGLHLHLPGLVKTVLFFHLICFGWLFFRAQSLTQVWAMTAGLVFNFNPVQAVGFEFQLLDIFLIILPVLIVHYFQRRSQDLFVILNWRWPVRGFVYFLFLFLIVTMGQSGGKEFIYFQF